MASRLHVSTPCRTAEEPLVQTPDSATDEKAKKIFLGPALRLVADRLGDEYAPCVEQSAKLLADKTEKGEGALGNPLICECEMVSMAELVHVAKLPSTHSLHDLRLRTRLGMGTCQGTFCALRAASVLVEQGVPYADDPESLCRSAGRERGPYSGDSLQGKWNFPATSIPARLARSQGRKGLVARPCIPCP